MIKLLTFTTLYPDSTRPRHGIFVEKRVCELAKSPNVALRVVAPCPWFPLSSATFGHYAQFARVPRSEIRSGIRIDHPRYVLLPKCGMTMAPLSLYRGAVGTLRRIIAEGYDFDLIDAHYFYPDGVAAVLLGRHFGRPVTITARGSDLNILPRHEIVRRMITWAAHRADGLITVSGALRERLVQLGIEANRITVLRNGVDTEMFRPADRRACRADFNIAGLMLLSVGNLVAVKGHDLVIDALTELPQARLVIVGDGPEKAALKQLAQRVGVADRVSFAGNVPQQELPKFYSAADVLVLASRHEGWPNVLLEAMACGTPVVVSDIPGMTEIVQTPRVGRLFRDRTPQCLARTIRELVGDTPSRDDVRQYAQDFGWVSTTLGQMTLFQSILESRSGPLLK